jgi:hydroxymethylpyrimidine pyrophosphatase-like HAD family hydrolase
LRYHALATDYDGTLATGGRLADETVDAITRLRDSGRRIILVTGRRLDDLREVCPRLDLFDCVVAENGAVLYWPDERETTALCPAPPPEFGEALRRRGVTPLTSGHVIVATTRPREHEVLDVIYELGLELQIIFNGEAVMVLPPGVNKGSGLAAALLKLGLSFHEVVAAGNAGNDHSFMDPCECSVAVADALPSLKARATFTTDGANGAGVRQLIDELVAQDLAARRPLGAGRNLLLGERADGSALPFPPYGENILVAGPSGAGKSTFATGLIERLIERSYQLCIIDPEGDYGTLDDLVRLGSRHRAPHIQEILDVLSDPSANLVINLLGVPLQERPGFFLELAPRLQAMRAKTGRPHWILVDEVHHLLPAPWGRAASMLPQRLGETILITMDPGQVVPEVLKLIDIVVAVGPAPRDTLASFARSVGDRAPHVSPHINVRGEVIAWARSAGAPPTTIKVVPARSTRLRHLRKYAEGNLGPSSFVFRGPHGRLKLRAYNLVTFCDLADGIDDETWLFHLTQGDYSRWVRQAIKDQELARELAGIERGQLTANQSRERVREAIDRRYTL